MRGEARARLARGELEEELVEVEIEEEPHFGDTWAQAGLEEMGLISRTCWATFCPRSADAVECLWLKPARSCTNRKPTA